MEHSPLAQNFQTGDTRAALRGSDPTTGVPATNLEPGRHSRQVAAVAVLVGCCLLWGWSFPTMQYASRAFDRQTVSRANLTALESLSTRALLNGLRFVSAGVLFALLTFRQQRNFTRAETLGGTAVGLLFGSGMLLQVLGLAWARPSVSGFLTSLAVVFAPIAQAGILRRPVGKAVWAAVGLALAGVTLLAWPDPGATQGRLTMSPPLPLLGEALTVMGSVVFTTQIMLVDHYGQKANPMRLTSVMLLTSGTMSLMVAGVLSGGQMLRPELLGAIAHDRTVWWSLGSLIVFSSVVAIPLMNTFQPSVSPATASVVYCAEPLFAAMFSMLLGTERLTLLTAAGGSAVFVAVLMVARSGKP